MASDKTIERKEKLAKAKNEGIEGEDFVICQWCKQKCVRIYGRHINQFHTGKTSKDYKTEFPGFQLMAKKDKESIIITGDAHHMKKDEHRQRASEAWKGENNCNHKSKVSEEKRKELSPFAKEFWMKHKKLSEEDAIKQVSIFAKGAIKDRISNTNLQYYLNLGQTNEEATKNLKKRQSTFSLEKCIEKFGLELGTKRWKRRQLLWHKHFKKKSYSFISQELFWDILSLGHWVIEDVLQIHFATILNGVKQIDLKNHELGISCEGSMVFPDFIDLHSNKIIEFDGTYYHRNTPENKKRSEIRDQKLKKAGYDVLHILESDYRKHPKETLQKCVDFLNS
jgi:hypothetical protein